MSAHPCAALVGQGVSGLAVLKQFQRALCLQRTPGDALCTSRREGALQQVLHAQCLLLSVSMLNTKCRKPSRSIRKASMVWCQGKEASSWTLQKLLRAKPKPVCVCVCVSGPVKLSGALHLEGEMQKFACLM